MLAGRLPADPPGRRRPGDGGPARPGPAPAMAGGPGRRGGRRDARLSLAGLDGDGRAGAGPRPTCSSRGTAPGSSGSPGSSSSTSGASPTRSPARSSRSARSFQHNAKVAIAANVWAVAATAIVALGWIRTLRRPRRRLAGLVPLCTLARPARLAVHRGRPVPDPADPVHPGRRGRGAGGVAPPAAIIPAPADRGGPGARGLAAVFGLHAGHGQGPRGARPRSATSTRPAPGSPTRRTGPARC